MRRVLGSVVVLSLLASAARAEPDCERCKDHPQVSRFAGFHITGEVLNDFNSIPFSVTGDKKEEKEGKYWEISYQIDEGAKHPTCAETTRFYESAFKKGGGRLVWKSGDSCQATFTMPAGPSSQRWLSIDNNVQGNGGFAFLIVDTSPLQQKVTVVATGNAPVPPAGSGAAQDCEHCKDQPQVSRWPGFTISHEVVNDFNALPFEVGDDKKEEKEGKFWDLSYQLREGATAPSCVESARKYQNAFQKVGGKMVWHQENWCDATFTIPLGKYARWMWLDNNTRGNGSMSFRIVDSGPMEQKVQVGADLLSTINLNGAVSLYGIYFDTGKDILKPESGPTLAAVVKLLTDNKDLKLIVAGHTDHVGTFESNMDLSRRRAAAVVNALTAKGIAAARLNPQGLGPCAPIATNDTDAGRAQNRRVELVKE